MRNKLSKNRILTGVMALSLLLCICSAAFFRSASAAESSGTLKNQINELQGEKDKLSNKIKDLQKDMADNLEQIEEISGQKSLIDQQIALLYQQVELMNQQIAACAQLIADKQVELEAAQAKLTQLQKENKARIRAMEKNGKISYWSVLFKANSFVDLLDRLKMIHEIAAADKARIDAMCRAAEEVKEAKQVLEEEKAGMETTRQELVATQESLDAKSREAASLLASLTAKGQEFEALMAQSEDKQASLMEQIAQKEKDYDDAVLREWLATSIPETTAPPETSAPTEPTENEGDTTLPTAPKPGIDIPVTTGWLLPIASYTYLSDPFGMRWHPIHGDWRMHYGVDLAAPTGTPIYATRGGVVTTTDYEEGGAGHYVSINHGDGFASIYMHLTHYIVEPGQVVTAGEVIGYCGSTGGSTGPHLHFGISYKGTYVDPADYIPI